MWCALVSPHMQAREFLVPKSAGRFRMVVNYHKVNTKIVFDSYPMPTIDQVLEQFSDAAFFFCSCFEFCILPNSTFS